MQTTQDTAQLVPSVDELTRATRGAGRLLEAVGLTDFRYAVEARPDTWVLRVDCQHAGAWHELEVPLRRELLSAGVDDEKLHRAAGELRGILAKLGLEVGVH